jgi:hypothetical protein
LRKKIHGVEKIYGVVVVKKKVETCPVIGEGNTRRVGERKRRTRTH